MPKIDRKKVLGKCNGRCGYCGKQLNGKFQVDHIIPQREYWACIMNKWRVPPFLSHLTIDDVNHFDNLLPSCASCNNYKTGNPLEIFRGNILNLVPILNSTYTQYKIAKRFDLVVETVKPVVFYFETL